MGADFAQILQISPETQGQQVGRYSMCRTHTMSHHMATLTGLGAADGFANNTGSKRQ